MRNLEKYIEDGKKLMKDHSRFDMQLSNLNDLLQESTPEQAILKAFYAGVSAGSRIEKKNTKAEVDKTMYGMMAAQDKVLKAVIKAERQAAAEERSLRER